MTGAIVSAVAAIAGAVIGASAIFWKGAIDIRQERARQLATIRRRYLEPLRLSSADLVGHLQHIDTVFSHPDKHEKDTKFLTETFEHLETLDRSQPVEFARWCNGVGYFAAATLYRTAMYCWAADRVKRELLFEHSRAADDQALLENLEAVREALGGEHGIWQTLQDSVGTYVRTSDGEAMTYREFCASLGDEQGYIWLLRLIDFYKDVDQPLQQTVIRRALAALDGLEKLLRT